MKRLRKVQRGDLPRAEDINQLVDALGPLLNIRGSRGIRVQTTSGGIIIVGPPRKSGGGGGTEGRHPFEVYPAGNAEDGTPQVAVEIDSWLMRSQRASDKQTITGLGTAFTIEVDQMIWLELTFDAEEGLTTATIEHGAQWDGYDSPVQFDSEAENKRQEKARILLAYTQAVPDPNDYTERHTLTYATSSEGEPETLQLVQCVTTHLMLGRCCFESDTVQLPIPYFAPGPAPA
jgi:hypothetical protein